MVRRLGHTVQAGVYILRDGHLVRNNTIVTSPYQRSTSELQYCNTAAEDDGPGNVVVVVRESRRGCYGLGRPFTTNWAGAYYSRG